MDLPTLTTFFMWSSIINGAMLFVSVLMMMVAPDFVYRLQTKWFPMPRETFPIAMYAFVGLFKIFFLVFNLVPYIVLSIMG